MLRLDSEPRCRFWSFVKGVVLLSSVVKIDVADFARDLNALFLVQSNPAPNPSALSFPSQDKLIELMMPAFL